MGEDLPLSFPLQRGGHSNVLMPQPLLPSLWHLQNVWKTNSAGIGNADNLKVYFSKYIRYILPNRIVRHGKKKKKTAAKFPELFAFYLVEHDPKSVVFHGKWVWILSSAPGRAQSFVSLACGILGELLFVLMWKILANCFHLQVGVGFLNTIKRKSLPHSTFSCGAAWEMSVVIPN